MIGERKNRRRSAPTVERLENLEMLAATFNGGVWTINGSNRADVLVVDRDPTHAGMLRAFQNGKLVGTRAASSVVEIRLNGLGGNDRLKIDESRGAIGIRAVLKGGAGRNVLIGGSGQTVLDGGPSRASLLQPGTGPTTFLQGVVTDSVSRFGSTRAFRQFLSKSATQLKNRRSPLEYAGGVNAPAANPTGGGAANGDHSNTRVQVAGVDEADIVETDGSYLYLLSRGELVIVDARSPGGLAVASRTSLEGSPIAEYLDGNHLTVLTSIWNTQPVPAVGKVAGDILPGLFVRGSGQVRVTTFDISDPTKPKTLVQTTVDGSYSDSRVVDGKLYLVLQNDLFVGTWRGGPIAYATARVGGGSSASAMTSLANAPLDRVLPGFTSVAVGSNGAPTTRSGLVSQPGDIYRPALGDDANLMSVVVLDTRSATPGPIGSASVVGAYASTLHVTADSLYVFSPRWDEDGGSTTSISQFSLSGVNPTLVATGSVPGNLIDQYSADAYKGDLRVATTTWNGTGGPSSGVYVLRPTAGRLQVIGKVDGISPGEQLFAARFEGDRAYLVTFEQVDPLHSIDLSNPSAPKLAGELVVPGFSRQLVPVGDGLLVGIGREADPNTGRATDLKVSLFDVHDLNHPALVASQTIAPQGTDWNWSGAEWDPHALGWFPEKGILAIPVSGVIPPAPDADPSTALWKTQSDLYVFKLDTTAGANAFRLLGKVTHGSDVSRSARIGDVLYSIADQDVKSVRVVDSGLTSLGQIVIQTETSGWPDNSGGGGGGGGGGVVIVTPVNPAA